MKLIRAKFENFRLLRHLELDFSTDNEKKLTVIRAANETGKTTILNGLQWAFYGEMHCLIKDEIIAFIQLTGRHQITGAFKYPQK